MRRIKFLPMTFRRWIYCAIMAMWRDSAVAEEYFFAGYLAFCMILTVDRCRIQDVICVRLMMS